MSSTPPDVQSSKPVYSVPIHRVGVKNVYRKICLKGSRGKTCLDAHIDIFIDLPKDQRGIHVSRNIEAVLDVFEVIEYTSFTSIEEAIEKLCRQLLEKHNYANDAEVKLSTVFLYDYVDTSLNLKEYVPVKLSISSKISREKKDVTKKMCIEVTGMTVCPCALQVCSYVLNMQDYAPSHTQRTVLRICITTKQFVDAAELVEIALNSFSIPVFSYLKRDKECKMILRGFSNAKFAEDVVRSVLRGIYEKFNKKLDRSSMIYVSLRSFESIHPFDLLASTKCSIETLKKYFAED